MSTTRIPSKVAAQFFIEKFDITGAQANFCLSKLTGYILPEGDQKGDKVPISCLFYDDLDIYRYAYPDEDKILTYYGIPQDLVFIKGIWRLARDNPDYPYKLDVYTYKKGYYELLQDSEMESEKEFLSHSLVFVESQIKILSKDFGYTEHKEE